MARSLLFLLSAALYFWAVVAFPDRSHAHSPDKTKRQNPSATPKFDAKAQLVSTSGRHAFKPPGPLDQRGPCPGLNAMANHGYLPRSGFATINQYITACKKVFGMGGDLATILAIYGAALDGPGAGWSIGGGPHIGIGGSHNNYESDSSPLRADLHQHGSNTKLVMSQFHDLYDLQPDAATANYDIDVIKKFRAKRFQESIDKNPYFFYAPFSGAIVSQAAFTFIYRFMGNKSAEHPTGVLNKNVLKSFMSVYGPEDKLRWKPGWERIPDDWYTRNADDAYTINYFSEDSAYVTKDDPRLTQGGCNTGKVNSYTKVDYTYMSGDKVDPKDIQENPVCFGLKYALNQAQQHGNTLTGLVLLVLEEAIVPAFNALGCTTVPDLNTTVGKACPGYSLFGGPKGDVAPGAIKN